MSFLEKRPRMTLARKRIVFSKRGKGSQTHAQCISGLMASRWIRLGQEIKSVTSLQVYEGEGASQIRHLHRWVNIKGTVCSRLLSAGRKR